MDALETAVFEMTSFHNAIGTVKNFVPSSHTYNDQEYKVYVDQADGQSGAKKISVHQAVRTIVGRGFTLPSDMRFYLTSSYVAQNRAFHFDGRGNSVSWVTLGTTALQGGSGQGISAQETPGFDACTKIAIHEIGHSLHGRAIGLQEFFKPAEQGRWKGTVEGGAEISAYAAKSKKEFVAEFFLGTLVGRNYSAELKQAYRDLGGPTVEGFI